MNEDIMSMNLEELRELLAIYKDQRADVARRIDQIETRIGRLEAESKNWTPRKAIRAKCLDCCCDSRDEVKNCPTKKCALYPYRQGDSAGHVKLSVIKEKCFECSGYNRYEVDHCKILTCPLWQYRNGHNPKLEGKGNANALLAYQESIKAQAAEINGI